MAEKDNNKNKDKEEAKNDVKKGKTRGDPVVSLYESD